MSKPFIITTDASSTGIGYVLSQRDDNGAEHPVAFNGRALRGSEKNWGITELERLSLVEAIREFHPFLNHQKFTVFTDHISLTWLQTIKRALEDSSVGHCCCKATTLKSSTRQGNQTTMRMHCRGGNTLLPLRKNSTTSL